MDQLSFLQSLERDYPINAIFAGVAGDIHTLLENRKLSSQECLTLLEKLLDVDPDTTGVLHGYQLAVIDKIRGYVGFSGLLRLGESLTHANHQLFFSRLLFSYMGHRLEHPDAAFEADMTDFGIFCQKKGFQLGANRNDFIKKSPACYHLYDQQEQQAA